MKISELRAVVAFLRKEKEIVDLQLELSKQESARFKAQVDRLTHSLEESRQALAAVRYSHVFAYFSPLTFVLYRNASVALTLLPPMPDTRSSSSASTS